MVLDGLEADCDGDYKWNLNSFVKGDGWLKIKMENSRVELMLEVSADAKGAPTELSATSCDIQLDVRDVQLGYVAPFLVGLCPIRE